MIHSPSRAPAPTVLMLGLCLASVLSAPAQWQADVPSISSFAQLQQELDAAWVNRTTSALYPPGMSYTTSLPLIAVGTGFDPALLTVLQPSATPGGVPLRKGIVREDLAGRLWFGAAATPVATTSFPAGYDPVQWVLDTFPPPAGVIGTDLNDYIAARRLTRQSMAFSLIAAADVPAYQAELQARLAAASAAAANLGEEDIGMIQVELTPPSGPMEILVRAPFWVDYLGVYETRDLMNPFPWTPLGTVPHTFDTMAWSYPLPGDLRYVILANHMVDSDGDGILDAIEKLLIGTDPDKWDSDGDGVGDFDEVYIHESNPLLGGVGGVSDQIKYGLGLPGHDMSKIISGSAGLRFKMRRAVRDKQGFPGFVDGATTFLGYQSDYKFGQCGEPAAQHVHYEGSYDLDYALPSLKYKVVCPVAREGSGWNVPLSEVGIPNAAPMYMPEAGSPLGYGETRQNASGTAGGGGMTSSGSLSRPYSDVQLLARTSADYGGIHTKPLDWDRWMLLTRPLAGEPGGATPPNLDPTLALLDPVVGLTPPAARQHVHFDGPETQLMRAELQGIGLAAAVESEIIPPGYLLRTIHLEVARKPPTEAFPAGEISRVTPREVYLKPGTPLAESMEFKIPPPAEEGTVEVVDGYVDLRLQYVSEKDEESVGDKVCTGITVPFSVERGGPWNSNAVYRMYLDRPAGSQAVVRHLSAEVPSGSQIAFNLPHCSITPDLPGVYSLRVEVASALPGDAGATPLLVDRVVIHAVPSPTLCADYNRDGRIDDADETLRDTPFGPNQEPRRLIMWVNDDDDEKPGEFGQPQGASGDDSLASARYNASLNDLPFAVAQLDGGHALGRQDRARDADDNRVDGLRDLVDFFPVHMALPKAHFFPGSYVYRLRTDTLDSLRFAYSKVAADEVGRLHTDLSMERYDTELVTQSPDFVYATMHPADNEELTTDWLENHEGVVFLEGRSPSANEQLTLEICNPSQGGRVVGRAVLPVGISNAHLMFRYINVREASELYREGSATAVERPNTSLQKPARIGALAANVGEPLGLPDGYYRYAGAGPLKTIVVIHGVDWDEDETPAGMVELFKRLHQSGSNARFVGVSWPANMGRDLPGLFFGAIPISKPGPIDYYEDVISAFVSAKHVRNVLVSEALDGPDTVILAHSLGNILTSSMIQDHGLNVGTYMMLNAAVPIESYQGEIEDEQQRWRMVHPAWKTNNDTELAYAEKSFASKWYKFFAGTNDPRGALTWQSRFGSVSTRTRCINLYSSKEEVLNTDLAELRGEHPHLIDVKGYLPWVDSTPDVALDREFIWVRQEMQKGKLHWFTNLLGLTNVFDDHGGWGNPGGGRSGPSLQQSLSLTNAEFVADPYFQNFNNTDSVPAGMWVDVQNWIYQPVGTDITQHLITPPFAPNTTDIMIFRHAKLLAEAIPALSVPAGGHAIIWPDQTPVSLNIDMSADTSIADLAHRWPSAAGDREGKGKRWLHGDYKDVAYLYVKGLYNYVVNAGELQ